MKIMSDELKSKIESLLIVTSKPVSIKKLAEVLSVKPKEVEERIELISRDLNNKGGGIRLLQNNGQVQLASAPDNAALVQEYLKNDLTGELTKPSLETLTIIAYRQPITKAEIEQIRGVNCSLILRNLMIRGLVEAEYNKERSATEYAVTLDFVIFLGLNSVNELPDFAKLNSDENLEKLFAAAPQQLEADDDRVIKVAVNQS